jgi:outer membrane murein-binding lipoprotein Lpp
MKNSSGGFSIVITSIIVLLVLIAAAAAAFGTYTWQHNKVNTLTGKVSSLNTKVSSLNNQLSALSGQVNKSCPQAQQSTTNPTCAGYNYVSAKGVSVLVFTPSKNETITSPVAIVGEVPGNWSFEAQFPVQLKDGKGNLITQAPAHLLANWETTQLVPFSVQLTYTTATSGSGAIVLQEDNPSGLPRNSDSVSIPISF